MCSIIILFVLASIFGLNESVTNKTFPEGFKIGTASASYQIEGGWDADGKGENIWDYACHTFPDLINNRDNGDIACDSYHKYERDVNMLTYLGVNHYRLSISWSRILPTGFDNKINDAGVEYYKNVIQLLLDNNIEPIVTIYHWDLPQPLQLIGGWTNSEIVDHFAAYAKLVFQLFGDQVKLWATFNEPTTFCHNGYGGTMAPFYNSDGIGNYLCGHNVIKAHAKAYHIYHDELQLNGRVSIVLNTDWCEPGSDSTEDIQAAEDHLQFSLGWFAHPIYLGNYPQVMIDKIGNKSQRQGFSKSRLPEFTSEEIDYINGTSDYFSINHYTTTLVTYIEDYDSDPGYYNDMNVHSYRDPSWEGSASDWLKVVPWGIRKLLNWLKNTYNDPEILITENGFSDEPGTLDDQRRINYYSEYMGNVLDALYEDGVNVTGYTAWSLMDNFEWAKGYTERFGLYYVDFENGNERTIKASGEWFKNVLETRCLVNECVE